MDLTAPDFARLDHRQHAAVGAAAAGLSLAALYAWDHDAPLPARIIIPITAAFVVGMAKEAFDYQHPESHTCETGDLAATTLGALPVVAINLSWSF